MIMAQIEFTVLEQIQSAFHLEGEESEAALLLLKNYARQRGMTLDTYMQEHHPQGFVQKAENLSGHYKGYVQFLGEDAKSIIHAGKNADYSTFVHECAHVFRRQLTGKLRQQAEAAFEVQDGVWTVEQDERFAEQLEAFIRTRETLEDRKKLMRSGAAFVRDTYNGLNPIIDIKPEIQDVFEQMFQNTEYVFKQKEYEDTLHRIASGERLDERSHVFLGMTPPLYQEMGLEEKPLMIRSFKIHTAMNEQGTYHSAHFHGLGEDILKQIPEKLKKPLCIIQSDSHGEDVVSLIELKDKDGRQVIVPIAQNERGYFKEINIDINRVKSIYGKDNFDSFLRAAIREDRLLYADKKRSQTLLQSSPGMQKAAAVIPGLQLPNNQDISGFYLENIARYKEKVKEIREQERQDGFARLSGATILFHTNVAQMELDFGDGGPERSEKPERKELSPSGSNSLKQREAAPEGTPPEPDFSPSINGNTHDYTACKANTVFLADEKTILDTQRPPYIPEIDLKYMRYHHFLPPFYREGENVIVKDLDKNHVYKMTPEVFVATVDYYAKAQKAHNKKTADTIAGEYPNNDRSSLRPPERVVFLPRDKMTGSQTKAFEEVGLKGEAAWKEYFYLRDALRQKLSDMSLQKEDWENAYNKGRETAYGDGNTNDALFRDYGVLVKLQNGDAIRGEEIHDVEKALNSVSTVFGDLRAVSEQYGLKISHAGERNMHARQAVGIFHSQYRAVGVSFANREAAPFILAHESAHFLDCAAGKADNHFFASDKTGSPENSVATVFRQNMNRSQERTVGSPYLNRTCECFARALEQYTAYTLSPEQYALFCSQEGYVNDERFTTTVLPAIETLLRERDTFWHPDKERTSDLAREAPEQYVPERQTFRPYGAWTDFGRRLSVRERELANTAALDALHKPVAEFTEKDRDTLRRYSGFGGISVSDERGVLYDYYTSPPVAKMTWDLLQKIRPLGVGETVLEPSCGTGVFFETAPAGLTLSGVELDERTASIAARLHPGAVIENASFEQFNITDRTSFDRIVGNAPFGERTLETAFMDLKEEKSLDNYFVTRSIDRLKPGGAMALIVHPGVLANKTNEDWRLEQCRKAQFLGAVKLNDHSFTHTHTGVQPDILFFQKYDEDIQKRLQNVTEAEFKQTALYAQDWVSGAYFDTHQSHVMGELDAGAGQWGNDVVRGEVTPETIKALLDVFTPEKQISTEVLQAIREKYEFKKEAAQKFLTLDKEESERVQDKRLRPGSVKVTDSSIYILGEGYTWDLAREGDVVLAAKLERTGEIASHVGAIRTAMREGLTASETQQTAQEQLREYRKQYGAYPGEDTDVNRFLRRNPTVCGIYEAFLTPEADILTRDNLYDKSGKLVNGHNQAVEALLLLREQMREGTPEAIGQCFPDTKDEILGEMQRNPDIFLTPENTWQLREDFISGSAWDKIDALNSMMESESDIAKKEKLRYGIEQLREAAGWVAIEDADFTPHSSWIPEEIINSWVTDEDGLDRNIRSSVGGALSRNDEGKWGIRYDTDHTFYERGVSETRKVSKGQWGELADEVVYYLNMQKQRSKYYDTETYNREHNEGFKNYIANHPAYRDELEQKYNRLFNTEIGGAVKTYPVYLDGWDTESKTLRGHQWQSVHHLYREGKGISALGTGFGKTLAAAGLHTLLQQEQKINRAWFQVPNNKVKDWVAEIRSVMPERKTGFIDPESPGYGSREKRFAAYQALANSNYEILIMPESAASEIQLNPENDERISGGVIADQLTDKAAGGSARRVQQAKDSAERKLENGKTNRTITFEDFGCDALFVDEAHRYKNLFSSSLSRETGLNDGRQSNKAMALFKKAEYIRGEQGGKNVFLFTATPLTNSPLEYYNMLMYIAPEELRKFGIHTIDGFIKNFADIEEKQTYDWKTGQIANGRVLSGFKNIQTLQDVFFKYTDYQNDPAKIHLQKPDANNKPNVIPQNETQTAVLKELSEQLERYQKLSGEKRQDKFPGQNFLTFYTKMRTASLDLELYDPDTYSGWDNPKLDTLAKNAYENYRSQGGGQVVFCDRVFSSDYTFNIHEKMKASLAKAGFREDEIIIVNGFTKSGGAKSDSVVEKEVSEAVAAFNRGKYKVIIGSTACIGEGLNLQANSSALHHFDIPFRPSDFIQRNGRIDRQGNVQKNVELHTYMAAGTIDNYSVSLVEKKAGWIDKLLKTKSNVFVNEGDESFVDADELLLALTESWGDKEKARERREELSRIKSEKLLEAQDKDRRDTIANLSLMKNAVLSFEGDKGTTAYQTRLRKIDMLEKTLQNNPTFKEKEIIGSKTPFLYSKAGDFSIRKGDIILDEGTVNTVTGLNLKKQEFTCKAEVKTPFYMRSTHPGDTYIRENSYSIHDYKIDAGMMLIRKPSKELQQQLKSLHTEAFYHLPDNEFKEKYYARHLMAVKRNEDFKTVYFGVEQDTKKLKVDEFKYASAEDALNPFSEAGRKSISKAAQKGVVIDEDNPREILAALKKCLPEQYTLIKSRIAEQARPPEPKSKNRGVER
ncbi:hypothetical protein FACS189473_2040 [Spirochaetia bacterium]|nr:hypothetical protein FACS189473_2040 [Spirochaetia bacterium]